jgi:hypothetical protein
MIKEYRKIIKSLQPDRVWRPGQIAVGRDTIFATTTVLVGVELIV